MNSKNKGNTFERKIANLLSKTFETYLGISNGFRRNSDSGSFYGGTNQKRITTHNTDYACYGDIICPKSFKYSIECKHYKDAPTLKSIIDGIKQWDEWIIQCEQDSNNSKKLPMIIIKYNNVPEIVLMKNYIGIDPILHYKNYNCYKLESILQLSTDLFFD